MPQTNRELSVEELLEQTRDSDAGVRRRAVRELCPCAVKFNSRVVWDRLIEMIDDPDVDVRRNVFHDLIDGSPRAREAEIVTAVERLRDDPHLKLRRRARKVLAGYRRHGRINVG